MVILAEGYLIEEVVLGILEVSSYLLFILAANVLNRHE
jgi:hypothetical protein